MYKTYFGIREKPFSIAPDPSFLFMSERHREALAHLLYGIDCESGFVLLTGEVGTGKTTICRCLLEQIPETSNVAYIVNPKLSVPELLATICDEFGIKHPQNTQSIKLYIDRINQFLIESHAKGHSPVLIIDEAQNLSNEVLEQIRLLTNLETNERKLLLIIMIGQPELRDKLTGTKLTQLQQRITARYHLEPLSRPETAAYIRHRLSIAGLKRNLFLKSALKKIYALSQGIPRVINLLCDRAMLGAYVHGKLTINGQTVALAADETLAQKSSRKTPVLCFFASAVAIALILVFLPITPLAKTIWPAHLVAKLQEATLFSRFFSQQHHQLSETIQKSLLAPANQPEEIGPTRVTFDNTVSSPAPPVIPLTPKKIQHLDKLTWPQSLPVAESKAMAFQALFQQWAAPYNPENYIRACTQAEQSDLSCLFKQGNMGSLRKINRPAVMGMINNSGQKYFATIITLKKEVATLIVGQSRIQVSLEDIEEQWSGSYTLLWKAPPGYQKAILPGSHAPWLSWLNQQLAAPNEPETVLPPSGTLEGKLLAEVKRFQRANGLVPDGVVGPQTIISLNSITSGILPELRRGTVPLGAQRLSDNRGQLRETEWF